MDQPTADILKDAFSIFGTLTKEEAPVVVRKLRGETNLDIVLSTGLIKQTVFRRWKELKRKNPVWSSLSNGMEGKRGGGRKIGGPGRRKKPQGVR